MVDEIAAMLQMSRIASEVQRLDKDLKVLQERYRLLRTGHGVLDTDLRLKDARAPLKHGERNHAGYIGDENQVKFDINSGHHHDGSDSRSVAAGVSSFLALTDTPDAYTGMAGKYCIVNPGENAIDFDTLTHDQIVAHIAATQSVHNFDASGNAPAQAHASSHVGSGSDLLNTGNLLAGITPTFAGWNTNPGTNAKLVDELTYELTTAGVQTNATESKITYDLGSSMRFVVYAFRGIVGTSTRSNIYISNDGTNYYLATFNVAGSGERAVSGMGKGRYIQLRCGEAATGNTISQLTMRAYKV